MITRTSVIKSTISFAAQIWYKKGRQGVITTPAAVMADFATLYTRSDTPKLLSGHSQMGSAANFRPWDMFMTHRSRFDRVSVRSNFLNRRLQGSRKLLWE